MKSFLARVLLLLLLPVASHQLVRTKKPVKVSSLYSNAVLMPMAKLFDDDSTDASSFSQTLSQKWTNVTGTTTTTTVKMSSADRRKKSNNGLNTKLLGLDEISEHEQSCFATTRTGITVSPPLNAQQQLIDKTFVVTAVVAVAVTTVMLYVTGSSPPLAMNEAATIRTSSTTTSTMMVDYASVTTFVRSKVGPYVWQAMKNMLVMEACRHLYTMRFFHQRIQPLFRWFVHHPVVVHVWKRYTPRWIQNGVGTLFEKSVKKRVEKFVTGVLSFGSGQLELLHNYFVGTSGF